MTDFSIVTFNVNRQSDRFGAATRMLKRLDADLICLQENTAEWEQALRDEMGPRYPYAVFHNTGGPGGIGCLSKHPLSSARLIPAAPVDGWFEALHVTIERSSGPLRVLNLHLRPPYLSRGGQASVPLAYSYVWLVRFLELRHFIAQCEHPPEIVCGDFNEGHLGLTVQWLRRRERYFAANAWWQPATWRSPIGPLTLSQTLDHILYRRGLILAHVGVAPDCGSDHRPLMAVFR